MEIFKYSNALVQEKSQFLNLDKISDGFEFESYIADLLKQNQFNNVEITKKTGDFGIDVIAEKDEVKYAVQCKLYSYPVGNKAIQEALAGKDFYNCHVAIVATNNIFTSAAKELAGKIGVVLWDREKILSMEKTVNQNNFIIPIDNLAIEDFYEYSTLYKEAIQVVEMAGWASVYLLQSRLKISQKQAGNLLSAFEEKGIIGLANGLMFHNVLM